MEYETRKKLILALLVLKSEVGARMGGKGGR